MLIFTDLPQGVSFVCFLERKGSRADEFVETHLQDRCRLALGKVKLLRVLLKARHTESDLSVFPVIRHSFASFMFFDPAKYGDDEVDHVAGLDETFLNLLLLQFLLRRTLYFFVMFRYWNSRNVFKICLKVHGLRASIVNGKHIDTVSVLELCLLIEDRLDLIDIRVLL